MLEITTVELQKKQKREEAEELKQMAITLLNMLNVEKTTGAEVFRYRKVLDDLMKQMEQKMYNNRL